MAQQTDVKIIKATVIWREDPDSPDHGYYQAVLVVGGLQWAGDILRDMSEAFDEAKVLMIEQLRIIKAGRT